VAADARNSDEITHPTLVAIYRYWDNKRRGRAMPQRADIDPTEIVRLLPYIFMVDVERDPLRFRYRLIGTAICEFLGRDFTGRMVLARTASTSTSSSVDKSRVVNRRARKMRRSPSLASASSPTR
jgi:hypothetical protein